MFKKDLDAIMAPFHKVHKNLLTHIDTHENHVDYKASLIKDLETQMKEHSGQISKAKELASKVGAFLGK